MLEAMRARHSVRSYTDRPITGKVLEALRAEIDACNREGGLEIRLDLENPSAFDGRLAHYGHFENVHNYLAMIGDADATLDQRVGYYGERIVLLAQTLGLNTCWVAMSYNRRAAIPVRRDQKRPCVIAIGYGATQGAERRLRPLERLCQPGLSETGVLDVQGELAHDWFRAGVEAANLAPSAVNQQKYRLSLDSSGLAVGEPARVAIRSGWGPCSRIDLGIAKRHFELAANSLFRDWVWA